MPKAKQLSFDPVHVRGLARCHTEAAIQTLASIMRQVRCPPSSRVMAAVAILDRGWGKPVQPVGDEDGGPLRVVIRQIIENVEENQSLVIEHDADEHQGELALSQPNDR